MNKGLSVKYAHSRKGTFDSIKILFVAQRQNKIAQIFQTLFKHLFYFVKLDN